VLCSIYFFCTHDLDPDAAFPVEYSAWVDGDVTYQDFGNDVSRRRFTGVKQSRTITQEGLMGPPDEFLKVEPPKYPPCQLLGRRCDHTIIAAVEAHEQIVVYSIDTVDPDDYDSLPAAMKDMRPDDPIGEELWDKLLTGLVNVTPGQDNKDHIETAMTNWRSDNPEGTARELYLALKRFTS
jgi:hypothetical protein